MCHRFHTVADILNPAGDMWTNTFLRSKFGIIHFVSRFFFYFFLSKFAIRYLYSAHIHRFGIVILGHILHCARRIHRTWPLKLNGIAIEGRSVGIYRFCISHSRKPFLHVGQHPSLSSKSKYSLAAQSACETNDRQPFAFLHTADKDDADSPYEIRFKFNKKWNQITPVTNLHILNLFIFLVQHCLNRSRETRATRPNC